MKLKFKAEARDVVIFCLFLILLLYLVALAVVNGVTFLEEGTLRGFNPLPAFSQTHSLQ